MERRYLVDYLQALQRRELQAERLAVVADYLQTLNDKTLETAEQHHPLADPAAYRKALSRYIKR